MEFWNNLPTFINITDVPPLPVGISQDEWKSFYVSKLIKAGAIPKSDLIDQEYYLGDHRRAVIAQWDSKLNKFKYNRTKFTSVFIDYCNHFEDDDGFALFVPIVKATKEQFEKNCI